MTDRVTNGTPATATPAIGDHLDRLRRLDACAVSDALDTLGLPGAVTGLAPTWPDRRVTVGRARTIKAGPKTTAGPQTHVATPLVASAAKDDIVVIDNAGRTDVSCFGGLLAQAAKGKGVSGVIVHGACRDIPEYEDLGLPVYALAPVQVSARGRIVQEDMDVPVQVRGVTVSPGDLVIADRNGVVFVPVAHAAAVIALAERIVAREQAMGEAVALGQSVVEVMHDSRFPVVSAQTVPADNGKGR